VDGTFIDVDSEDGSEGRRGEGKVEGRERREGEKGGREGREREARVLWERREGGRARNFMREDSQSE
jgi:hypothetical protein